MKTVTAPCLLTTAFLLTLLAHQAVAAGAPTFKSCMPNGIQLLTSSAGNYASILSNSFQNDNARPLFVIQARFEYDVRKAVECASRARLTVCARSGGHSYTGASLCKGVMIDLASFRTVKMEGSVIARVGPGATLGEMLWGVWTAKRRWLASGNCPGVGVAGFILGGGHGPYEGLLGLACDNIVSVRIVDRNGVAKTVSRSKNSALFWGMCGAGGGQFGIVTSFRLKTASSKPFDNAVGFRFKWPVAKAGEVLHEWSAWNQVNGRVWWRMEFSQDANRGLVGHGACYNVKTTKACMAILNMASFFKVDGRQTLFMKAVKKAVDLQGFFGPDGGWSSRLAADSRRALLTKRYVDKGAGNARVHQSTFLKLRVGKKSTSLAFWQKYANLCVKPGRKSIPWISCQVSLFNGAVNKRRNNAFPYRSADIITQYIIGGGSTSDKTFAYWRMKNLLKPFTIGGYVNYAESQLGRNVYPKYYWGKSLPRLKKLKKQADPNGIFSNVQPIPK